jgi:hypothetical protein
MRALNFSRSSLLLDLNRVEKSRTKLDNGMPGSMLCSSSNGVAPGTSIIWASHPSSGDANHTTRPGRLQAYDARDITNPIYSTTEVSARDGAGNFSKFNTPVVANGRVYLATFSNQIKVYGLLATNTSTAPRRLQSFYLRPNPATDYLEVGLAAEKHQGATEVALLDATGRELYRSKIDVSLLIQLPTIAPGLYTAEFYQNGVPVQRTRWVKQ